MLKELKQLAELRKSKAVQKAKEEQLLRELMTVDVHIAYTSTVLERKALEKEIERTEEQIRVMGHRLHSMGEELPVGLNVRTYKTLRVLDQRKLLQFALDTNPNLLTLNEVEIIKLLTLLPHPDLAQVVADVKITIASDLSEYSPFGDEQ